MAVITKAQIGEQDLKKWDGVNPLFARAASNGGTETLNYFGYEVDPLTTYGGGVSYTRATIAAALAVIGTTRKVTLTLKPGTWVIDQNTDWSAYVNVTLKIPPGAIISHGAFTFSWGGAIDIGMYQGFSGTGTVTLNPKYVIEAYPEWWGADPTGATSSSAAFNLWAACGCKKLSCAPGASYLIKEVTLPGCIVSTDLFATINGNYCTIIADGTDGSPASYCFTATFTSTSSASAYWKHFWEFSRFVVNTSGTKGFFTDFLVINITGSALVTDIHIKKIKAKGGKAATGTPANAIVKFVKTSSQTPENINIKNIQANGNVQVDRVVHFSCPAHPTYGYSGKFSQMFQNATDADARVIYSDCAITRSEFEMLYNAGGSVIDLTSCSHSTFDRIYQEALLAGATTVIGASYQHCDFTNIITIASAAGTEKLIDATMYWCTLRGLEHYKTTPIGYDTVLITGNENHVVDLFCPGETSTYGRNSFDLITFTGTANVVGPEGYEEGTWTPTLTGSGTAGTIAPYAAYNECWYKRTGNLVQFSGLIKVETVADSPAGLLKISLPYTVETGAKYSAAVSVVADDMDATAVTSISAYAETGNKFIYVTRFEAGSIVNTFAEYINTDTSFRVSGTYVAKSNWT